MWNIKQIAKSNQISLFGDDDTITKMHYPVMVGDFFENLTNLLIFPSEIISKGVFKENRGDLISNNTLIEVKASKTNRPYIFGSQQWSFYQDYFTAFPFVDILYCFYQYDNGIDFNICKDSLELYTKVATSIKGMAILDHNLFYQHLAQDDLAKRYLFNNNWLFKFNQRSIFSINSDWTFESKSPSRFKVAGISISPFKIVGQFSSKRILRKVQHFLNSPDIYNRKKPSSSIKRIPDFGSLLKQKYLVKPDELPF